jgi:hypothetical protein
MLKLDQMFVDASHPSAHIHANGVPAGIHPVNVWFG